MSPRLTQLIAGLLLSTLVLPANALAQDEPAAAETPQPGGDEKKVDESGADETAKDASGNVVERYTYDAFGRRSTRTVGNTTWRYVYAGPWLIQELVKVGVGSETLEAKHCHG